MMKGVLGAIPLLLALMLSAQVAEIKGVVKTVFSWDQFHYDYLPHSEHADAGGCPYYNATSVLPMYLSYHDAGECMYLGVPRRAEGVPATVVYFSVKNQKSSPHLRGFPTYKDNYLPGWFGVDNLAEEDYNVYPDTHNHHSSGAHYKSHRNSYHFVSVENTYVHHKCSRLFFLDSGVLQYPKGNRVVRNPVLWAFDVYGCDESTLDKPPALKVKLPDYVYKDPTGFHKFTLDFYGPSCNDFAVYLPNARDNRVVVYDNVKRSFWYYEHKTFQPGAELAYVNNLPAHDNYKMGVLSMTLGNTVKDSCKEVFYSPGSSYGLFRTTTKVLLDKHQAPGDYSSHDFEFVGTRCPESQSTLNFNDYTSVVFSVSWVNNRLTCWKTNKPLVEKNVVTLFSDLHYGADLCFNADEKYVWFMLYNVDYDVNKKGSHHVNDYYYRVYRAKVTDLVHGTNCE